MAQARADGEGCPARCSLPPLAIVACRAIRRTTASRSAQSIDGIRQTCCGPRVLPRPVPAAGGSATAT